MADSEIPADLLAAQRAYDAAEAAVTALMDMPRPSGRLDDWPAGQRAELERLMAEARLLELILRRALVAAGPQWASADGQERLRDAAAEQG